MWGLLTSFEIDVAILFNVKRYDINEYELHTGFDIDGDWMLNWIASQSIQKLYTDVQLLLL